MAVSVRETFEQQQYTVMPSVVLDPLLGFLWRYVIERDAIAAWAPGDREVTSAGGAYGDTVMEHLLERLRPRVEAATGLRVYPAYSYVRLYKTGDRLAAHLDRPACEISLSVNLGQDPPVAWPLWFRGSSGPAAVELQAGDAVLYRGMELEHWREPYAGVRAAQVFLHYVDRDGPCAEWKFDKRNALSISVHLPI
jgi:hypothetical protein